MTGSKEVVGAKVLRYGKSVASHLDLREQAGGSVVSKGQTVLKPLQNSDSF